MFERTVLSAAAVLLVCGGAHAGTLVRQSAGPTQQTLTVSDTALQTTQAQCTEGYIKLPGATVSITTPPGANQLLTARFTGLVSIAGGNPVFAQARLRIVLGARELLPAGADYGVASTNDPYTATALERSIVVAPGSHIVVVQYCVGQGDGTQDMAVWNWHLTVEAAPLQ
jgi:hypothetical protein